MPLGSGSCSCGAVVNGIRRGLLDASVRVECDGGDVTVRWDGAGSVLLSGPVVFGFSGNWLGERRPRPECPDRRASLSGVRPARPARCAPGRKSMFAQCLSSSFFGFGGDGTFAYWNAGVAFSASFVAPGR